MSEQNAFDRISRALAGRYRVDREAGRGGMAVVYLAEDVKHNRQVAIKVLLPEVAAAIGGERFLREIQIAAQLHHPHILALYDSGDADGLLYYVMPFVPGESLRQRIEREGQLPLEDALQITGEVASALGHAHMQGIVHRDVKPENILLSGGYALVADFGIARAITSAGGDQLTTTGITIGTPAYMSPEQAMAVPQIDGRSDQYSLACVLYEMLTGAPPFSGPSAQAVLARHTLDPVPPVRTLRATVPPVVEQAVVRALAKVAADRYPTAAAFQAALTGPATATPHGGRRLNWRAASYLLGGVALAAAGYVAWSRRVAAGPSIPFVAVLPFGTISGDSAFAAGTTVELIALLGQVPGLVVAPRSTSLRYQSADDKERTELGVSYVVDGSVQSAANKLKVVVTIVSTVDRRQIWARTYEPPNEDIFGIQDSISRDIATALRVHLSPSTVAKLGHRPTDNPEAYALYLRGRFFYEKRTEPDLRKALEYFQSAIRLDSTYALAYSGLADTYSFFVAFFYGSSGDYYPRAKAAALRALQLDSALAETHTSLGFLALFDDRDVGTARREFDRALAITPGYMQARLFRVYTLPTVAERVEELQRMRAIEPFSLIINTRLAGYLYFEHRYEEALTQARKALELDATFRQARLEIVHATLMLDRCADALATIAEASDSLTGWWDGIVGYAYARCGHRDRALAQLDRLRAARAAGHYVSHFDFGFIYAGLGDKDHAFAELDSGVVARDFQMGLAGVDPLFANLQSDPRFPVLLQSMGAPRGH